ncbi:MAG: BadF/BadG/BcrA/BcrD ATPase family protein [Planctomycetota bacterium]|nr:BadF/BadG/BcrA/BcrD ATPase family protein [Planctomycetota bacterium]
MGSLDYCVGIDLGSTTTKAVVLGLDGAVLGRGITNSRSNYDVACSVALDEALTNARFALFETELAATALDDASRAELVETLTLRLREQQYLDQLQTLASVLDLLMESGVHNEAHEAVHSILAQMREGSGELWSTNANRRSDFFRDLAGERYLRLAEQASQKGYAGFDVLVGLFDKAILQVENTLPTDDSFARLLTAALTSMGEVPLELRLAVEMVTELELMQVAGVGTGYGRQRLPFPKESIHSEILCHGLGAHMMFPNTRTVLDIGGQDTKAIQVDARGIVTSFQMNDRCAAGCGRYLGYIADEMNLGLHELGPLANQSTRSVRINSTCTVFAGAELRERLGLGERREDILAGLHRAIILRAMSLLARSGGIEEEFTFTGGVAKNPAAVDALADLVRANYGEVTLNISPVSIYTGALGAAVFALRGADAAVAAEGA